MEGYPNALSFTKLSDNTPIVGWGTGASVFPGTDTSITYANSYPVAFMIPKDTVISGHTMTKNVSFYGVMSVSFDSYGQPAGFIVQALSSEMWAVKSGAGTLNCEVQTLSHLGHLKTISTNDAVGLYSRVNISH